MEYNNHKQYVSLKDFSKRLQTFKTSGSEKKIIKFLIDEFYDVIKEMFIKRTFFDTGGIRKMLLDGMRKNEKSIRVAAPDFEDTGKKHDLENPNPAVLWYQEKGYRKNGRTYSGKFFLKYIIKDIDELIIPALTKSLEDIVVYTLDPANLKVRYSDMKRIIKGYIDPIIASINATNRTEASRLGYKGFKKDLGKISFRESRMNRGRKSRLGTKSPSRARNNKKGRIV